ncbi:hypothetical protein EWM64_g8018 [Hericium alpestre]|uniref:DUF4470 domain-containing protein n=1 Tax=Hericium alpestre TaxID=135208 RepID=A0A4Y9ZP07_9AGAM|nr:hypothetical protein EWM64_g8018 [Hericium alpestre]
MLLDEAVLARSVDFTCCDVEPAILARNFLLFSLLSESDAPIDIIWTVFYDFFLKRPALDLLTTHSRRLLDCSQDLETWHQGQYGRFLKFCSRHTLAEVHQCWTRYAEFDTLPASRKAKVKAAFVGGMKQRDVQGTGIVTSVGRSAGPLVPEALMPTSEHFTHFWKTGINSMDAKDRTDADFVNPTFAYCNGKEGFDVHYGTDCLAAFHLALAFADVKDGPTRPGNPSKSQSAVISAQAQFAAWCQAFKKVIAVAPGSRVVIRAFVGEALAFCDALNYCASTSSTSTPSYVVPWKGTLTTFDGGDYKKGTSPPAPLEFDVIDTSNLVDHLGLLNILTVTVPLLARRPSSTLYTETLLPLGENAMSRFAEHFCGDMATTCLLLDIAPSSFLSRFTTTSNVHELLMHGFGKEISYQFHEHTSWKIISLADPLLPTGRTNCRLNFTFEPRQLANFLLGVYHKMFADEDVAFRMGSPAERRAQDGTIRYTRASYAAFLRTVKARIQEDVTWYVTMEALFDLLEQDRTLLVGSNNYQDLCCQLHYYNVFSVETFLPNSSIFLPCKQSETFRGWADVPTMVCLTLIVPRSKIRKIEQLDVEEVGTPPLWCGLAGPGFQSFFSTFRTVFGRVVSTGTHDRRQLSVEEDINGWASTSDLTVSLWVPAFAVSQKPAMSQISFMVRTTPATQHLQRILGRELKLFTTTLLDKEHVYITRERPGQPEEVEKIRKMSFAHFNDPAAGNVSVQMNQTCTQITSFTRRADISDAKDQETLENGALVLEEQVSPCAIKVTFGKFEEMFFFPFPVDGTRTKLRISRKSHYIEVVATPISGISSPGGFFVNPFPLIFDVTVLTLWNIHRINLDRLPALDITDKIRLSNWLNPHISLAFSDREKSMRSGGLHTNQDVFKTLVDVKDTLYTLFVRHTGIQGDGMNRVFGLTDPERGEIQIHTLLFVMVLRLDLPAHTVVLDAYALPMTVPRLRRLRRMLETLEPVIIVTARAETTAWKRLLPALAERCRTSWAHRADCAYAGHAPRSLEYAEDLCAAAARAAMAQCSLRSPSGRLLHHL